MYRDILRHFADHSSGRRWGSSPQPLSPHLEMEYTHHQRRPPWFEVDLEKDDEKGTCKTLTRMFISRIKLPEKHFGIAESAKS